MLTSGQIFIFVFSVPASFSWIKASLRMVQEGPWRCLSSVVKSSEGFSTTTSGIASDLVGEEEEGLVTS